MPIIISACRPSFKRMKGGQEKLQGLHAAIISRVEMEQAEEADTLEHREGEREEEGGKQRL